MTCPTCGRYKELNDCGSCAIDKMCTDCFFDHREATHGYVPPEKSAERPYLTLVRGIDLGSD